MFRVDITTTIGSCTMRRATIRSAHADGVSTQCRSSTTISSGFAAAASESRVSAASPARSGDGCTPGSTPNATSNARRCGAGRLGMPARSGYRSMWRAAYGSADSSSVPVVVRTRTPRLSAYSTTSATSDDLPIPASPSTTNAEPPLSTSRIAVRRAAISRSRPMTGCAIVMPSVCQRRCPGHVRGSAALPLTRHRPRAIRPATGSTPTTATTTAASENPAQDARSNPAAGAPASPNPTPTSAGRTARVPSTTAATAV